MATKKLRFEIFKRDGFRCQYCGRTPPEVVLEIDHVIPRAEGGKDTIYNYLTSCFDCNRGKGATKLDVIPESLAENMERMKEQRKQVLEYNKFLMKIENDINLIFDDVNKIFQKYYPQLTLNEHFRYGSFNQFAHYILPVKICEAMKIAAAKFQNTPDGSEHAVRYFCGICWKQMPPKGYKNHKQRTGW